MNPSGHIKAAVLGKMRLSGPLRAMFPVSYGLVLAGEGIQSAFHFGLNVVLMNTLSAQDFGVFAILFMMGALSVQLMNGLLSDPSKIHISQSSPGAAEALQIGFTATAIAVCTTLTLVAICVIGYWSRNAWITIPSSLYVGLWPLRVFMRSSVMARSPGQGSASAARSDFAYSLVGAGLILTQRLLDGSVSLPRAFEALCLANVVGIFLLEPRFLSCLRPESLILRRSTHLWRSSSWSLVGVIAFCLQGISLSWLVTLSAGPETYGAIAAGFTLLSPVRIATSAVISVFLVNLSRSQTAYNSRLLWQKVRRAVCYLGSLCVLYGSALVAFWPSIHYHLYSKGFAARPMLTIVGLCWLTATISSIYAPLVVLAQVRLRFRDGAISALAGAGTGLAAILTILATASPFLAVGGLAAGEIVTLICLLCVNFRTHR